MKIDNYTLTQEPESEVYWKLLRYALRRCGVAYVAVRPDMPMSAQCTRFLTELEPFVLNKVIAREWPGTQLVEGTAVVHYFAYNEKSADILNKYSTGLFQWVQPDLPEDLGLMKFIEQPWLVTIGHERDGYFILDDVEMADLVASIPELESMIRKD